MKYKLIVCALAIAGMLICKDATAQAHFNESGKPYNGSFTQLSTPDTSIDGADTSYLVWRAGLPYDIHIEATNTKVSGTVAGVGTLWGSDDKVTWFQLSNTTTGLYGTPVTDTVVLGDASETNHWFYGGPSVRKFYWYRQRNIYSGGVSTPTGTLYYLNPNAK